MSPARLEPFVPDHLWFANHVTPAPGGMRLPTRMVVARLAAGALWLHSPVPIDDALAAELATLGPVEHLVAPNAFHHLHADAAKARYPAATLWAPEVLRRKCPALPIDAALEADVATPWSDELAHVLIAAGPKMAEVVFHHRASRTLITTDLVFNLARVDRWWTRTVLRLVGALGGLRQSRLWRSLTRNREAARAAIEAALAWDIERVVPAHGDPVVGPDARDRLTAALWWMRGDPRPRSAPSAPRQRS
ncbi:MAG: hypothetical protein CVU56_21920 [Deltaproteobacteria bacterium HGW-Deltaproteobacteria-14]|jgi:glyoxylase-like metal-dependent hydrolase (beta-lactamase superfamily II)|nr:MAG: hypothetical protein CVU56_21920 [Deltaproteobacteria bacterium HGW-Deltaproteobacteria-14]